MRDRGEESDDSRRAWARRRGEIRGIVDLNGEKGGDDDANTAAKKKENRAGSRSAVQQRKGRAVRLTGPARLVGIGSGVRAGPGRAAPDSRVVEFGAVTVPSGGQRMKLINLHWDLENDHADDEVKDDNHDNKKDNNHDEEEEVEVEDYRFPDESNDDSFGEIDYPSEDEEDEEEEEEMTRRTTTRMMRIITSE
ncbi:hypothetical protein Sjap_019776 [Stephania japonica]|uniref:Uncharacterized protein n=1 Tax=Stephania japonica TaxID=461633 RepID=A0AAP0HYF5_9MAGN